MIIKTYSSGDDAGDIAIRNNGDNKEGLVLKIEPCCNNAYTAFRIPIPTNCEVIVKDNYVVFRVPQKG